MTWRSANPQCLTSSSRWLASRKGASKTGKVWTLLAGFPPSLHLCSRLSEARPVPDRQTQTSHTGRWGGDWTSLIDDIFMIGGGFKPGNYRQEEGSGKSGGLRKENYVFPPSVPAPPFDHFLVFSSTLCPPFYSLPFLIIPPFAPLGFFILFPLWTLISFSISRLWDSREGVCGGLCMRSLRSRHRTRPWRCRMLP